MNETKNWNKKLGFLFCSVWLAALTGCNTIDERPRTSADVYFGSSGQDGALYAQIRIESDFYEPLSPYGRWEMVGSYGRCWIPSGVSADWSPYSVGYWQRTDAGWYWVSDEPWGWATYHYGRWDSSPQYGWYWVPQRQWAPAWVSWRQGGGFVGWAPLGPSGRGVVAVNVRGTRPGGFVFVEERRFLDPVRHTTIVMNNTIINKTVINEGPGSADIERASGRRMQSVPAHQLRSKDEAKVVARHPKPTTTREKAVPAREPRQLDKPPKASVESPPPSAKRDIHQADGQSRVTRPDAETRVQQEKARPQEGRKRQATPAAAADKPETTPETKPEVKHDTRPGAKVGAKPGAERPATGKKPAEQKDEKDDKQKEKKEKD